jgi:hypothetical protein
VRLLPVLAVLLLLTACAAAPPDQVRFTRVELPPGAVPSRIAAAGDELVVAFRRDGEPGVLRVGADGATEEIPLTARTGYGADALWYSLAARKDPGLQVVAVGGRSGGAHGNVRWSVWRATPSGIAEQPQVFSTFGGYGAGDLVDAVLPATGAPLLVGTWESASTGSDVAVWTTDGTAWHRQSSAGTALESTRSGLNFPMGATANGDDVVIAGWRFAGGRQRPVVWTLRDGRASAAPLPDAGDAGVATGVSCADTCSVAGRVGGRLAVWQGSGNTWRRVPDVPEVPVGDEDRPPPPLGSTLVYSDRGTVRVATLGGDVRDAAGPSGVVTAVARAGDSTYVLAGPGRQSQDNNRTLWRAGPS